MMKRTVSSARNGGIWLKKRRFLKRILIFVDIKSVYRVDYQRLLCNAKNKRFSSPNDNAPTNIGCICGQNSLFVDFIHSIRKRMKKVKEMWQKDVIDAKPAL